ncbi:hypothetical protein OSTOST_00514 [Ostertagia ostertagi]
MVKRSLKKTICRNTLDIRTFETLLLEIEAMLNTDLHIIIWTFLSPIATNPRLHYYVFERFRDEAVLKAHHEQLINTLDYFWSLWRKDYLQALAERTQSAPKKAQKFVFVAHSW